mgnify:CR=1 FL=1
MNVRTFAANALRHLALPVPKRSGKTLNVLIEDRRAMPSYGIHCACPLAANYAWRAAHENGCDKIKVHAPFGHVHEFDTIDFLKKFTIARLGFLPRPFTVRGKTPRMLATTGHRALGNELGVLRHYVNVPHPISSSTLVETSHG